MKSLSPQNARNMRKSRLDFWFRGFCGFRGEKLLS